ncbi:DUF6356 family protein [bacterium]|nr:DUF6356 family protein [bacterium]
MFSKKCKEHLESVNESGLQHMATALSAAVKLQLLVPALLIHSVAPRWFTNTATNVMKDILDKRK